MKIKNLLFGATLATASVLGAVGVANVAQAAPLCPETLCKQYTGSTASPVNPINFSLSSPITGGYSAAGIAIQAGTGDLYIVTTKSASASQVIKYTASSGYATSSVVTVGTVAATLANIAVDSAGNIYLSGAGSVNKYNGTTGALIKGYNPGSAGFSRIAVDASDNVYAVRTNTTFGIGVSKLDFSTPTVTATNIINTTTDASLTGLRGIAVTGSNIFLTSGTTIRSYGISGGAGTELVPTGNGLNSPQGLAVGADGALYAANNGSKNVKGFSEPKCVLFGSTVISVDCNPVGGVNYNSTITTALSPFSTTNGVFDIATTSNKLFVLDKTASNIRVFSAKTVPEADVKLPTGIVLLGLGGGLIWKMKKNQRKNQLSLTQEEPTA